MFFFTHENFSQRGNKGFLCRMMGDRNLFGETNLGLPTPLKNSTKVRQHIHHIYEKLHVQNRTEAINKAFGKN